MSFCQFDRHQSPQCFSLQGATRCRSSDFMSQPEAIVEP